MAHDDDHQQLCRLLAELPAGLLPRNVFHAIARLMVTTTFVVVPLIERRGRVLTLLHERGTDDAFYPSMLNIPGTVIRATDDTLDSTYKRLVATELSDVPITAGPVFVGNVYDQIARGREISMIHWVEIGDERGSGQHAFNAQALPMNLVSTDRHRIEMAAAHFRSTRP
jgi:hypothetical protein